MPPRQGPVPVNDWPLVGRAAELAVISDSLRRPEISGVVLHGPGGMGKTRLALECLRLGEQAGFATARAVATRASSSIPLGALAPLLPEISAEHAVNLISAARSALSELAGGRSLLLFIDDAHLLDDTSASLVLQIAAEADVFVLVTVRSGEPISDAITSLWKEGVATRIDVDALSEEEVVRIIATVLGDRVAPAAVAALRKLSAGNPLALRELVSGAVESGALAEDGDGWHLARPLPVTPRLTDLVVERLGSLDAAESEVLELVALGEPVPLDLLEQMARPEAIEALERRGLVQVRPDADHDVYLAHPLHGEVLRASLGTLRTRNVLRSLADAVSGSAQPRKGDALRVATWRLESGGRADVDTLLVAARTAELLLDIDRACRFSEAAWEIDRGWEAGRLFGRTLSEQGRFEQAEAVLAEITPLARTDEDRVLVTVARTENLFRMGHTQEAEALTREQEALVVDAAWRAELVGHRATHLMLDGRGREALDLVAPFIEAPEPEGAEPGDVGHLRPLVQAAITAGTVMAWDGRPIEALALHHRAYAAHQKLWERHVLQSDPGIQAVGIMQALVLAGELTEAQAWLDVAWVAASEQNAVQAQAWFALLLGQLGANAGDMEASLRWYRTSSELWARCGLTRRLRWTYAGAALALASLGRAVEARELIDRLDALHAQGDAPPGFNEGLVDDARAWVLAAEGELGAARNLVDAAADRATEASQRAVAVWALHSVARLGEPERAAVRAAALRPVMEGPLLLARVDHVRALAERDGEALDAVGQRFEEVGAILLAAEAFADAARAHRRSQRARDATASAHRSGELAARLPGVTTPAITLVETVSPLTRREREVAMLAAQGLSSKAIAEKLFLSVRTVDNHLQRAYEKLGVKGRDGLAGAVGQLSG